MSDPQPTWKESPVAPPLARGEVHVWHICLGPIPPEMWALLSEDEQARANRFHFERDRDRFAACRAKLRLLLSQYAGEPPAQLVFDYGPLGKPSLRGQTGRDALCFNVSHTGDAALLAFARGRQLGVDVENVKTTLDFTALASRFMAVREADYVHGAADAARAFYACWTRKEAWMKAVGCGLSEATEQFDVSASLGKITADLRCEEVSELDWTAYDLAPGPDLIAAAVVVEGCGADPILLREVPARAVP